MVKNAKPVHGTDAVLKAYNIEGDVRVQYKDQPDFERIAHQFGIFDEWKVLPFWLWLPLLKFMLHGVLKFLMVLDISIVSLISLVSSPVMEELSFIIDI